MVLRRVSGTEPPVTFKIEGKDHGIHYKKAEELAKAIEERLG